MVTEQSEQAPFTLSEAKDDRGWKVVEERHGDAVLSVRHGNVFAADGVLLVNGQRDKPTRITVPSVPFERPVPQLTARLGKRLRFVDHRLFRRSENRRSVGEGKGGLWHARGGRGCLARRGQPRTLHQAAATCP